MRTLNQKTINSLREIIFRFLDRNKNTVFIFGSRTQGGGRKFSDIDVGVESQKEIPWHQLAALDEALEKSDLPYSVDIVGFNTVAEIFKKLAKEKIIKLN